MPTNSPGSMRALIESLVQQMKLKSIIVVDPEYVEFQNGSFRLEQEMREVLRQELQLVRHCPQAQY
jgi:hypothetical protein